MNISHEENERFLRKQIHEQAIIEWSQENPYTTKIKGFYKKFKNSFEAHVEKHPKSQKEKYIWEHLLEDYPENIANQYYELSKALIDGEIRLSYPGKYNVKNNSLDIDINIQSLVDTEETDGLYTNEIIRIGIKRSHEDNNKIVIATCHPRNIQKKNKFVYPPALNYFKHKRIDSDKYDRTIEYLFYSPYSNEFKEHQNRLEEITTNYLIAALEKIENLEYWKTKYDNLELTDLFNYEELIEHIDNLFLCNRFIEMKYDDNELKKHENVLIKTINRFANIDAYKKIENYINQMYHSCLIDTSKGDSVGQWKTYSAKVWNKLVTKYNIDIKEMLDNTAYECSCTGNNTKITKIYENDWFQDYDIIAIAAYNKFEFSELEVLLAARMKAIPKTMLIEEHGIDIEKDWDTLKYDEDRIIKIQDIIIKYSKSQKR